MASSDQLRAASDRLLRDLDVLATLEAEKRQVPPGDPRLVELATRIEQLARQVFGTTAEQRQLTEAIHAEAGEAALGVAPKPIAQVRRPVAVVLDEWRAEERRAAAAEPRSVEETEARARVELLRREYRDAFEAARRES
jgi:hypothetical protein